MKSHASEHSYPGAAGWFLAECAESAHTMSESSPKPWYHKGLRFECTGSGNCCRNHGAYAYVYLSDREVVAIAGFLGLEIGDFLARHCRIEDGWTVLAMDQPACPFLTEANRCSIYPVRPKQCATWPFWQENLVERVWNDEVTRCCPGVGQGPLFDAATIERLARETEQELD